MRLYGKGKVAVTVYASIDPSFFGVDEPFVVGRWVGRTMAVRHERNESKAAPRVYFRGRSNPARKVKEYNEKKRGTSGRIGRQAPQTRALRSEGRQSKYNSVHSHSHAVGYAEQFSIATRHWAAASLEPRATSTPSPLRQTGQATRNTGNHHSHPACLPKVAAFGPLVDYSSSTTVLAIVVCECNDNRQLTSPESIRLPRPGTGTATKPKDRRLQNHECY
ncbi:hypothetical protein BCV70DRAFT_35928 [Testicularia cyperi]|uniref:Uncharacterized protein n=1 Tax=Testicularia cyperi TaxID=1882483 RepID=A0A317XLQ3_9BASI|nr:hypothetical protein BCV70DRAFT_35928 [Testicularia cyperi]